MTDQQHPITPPPELADKWTAMLEYCDDIDIFTDVARWGADQELEACCEWVSQWRCMVGGNRPEVGLRAARRLQPPRLADQALAEIQQMEGAMYSADLGCDFTATRAALERLQELEQLND